MLSQNSQIKLFLSASDYLFIDNNIYLPRTWNFSDKISQIFSYLQTMCNNPIQVMYGGPQHDVILRKHQTINSSNVVGLTCRSVPSRMLDMFAQDKVCISYYKIITWNLVLKNNKSIYELLYRGKSLVRRCIF